MHEIHQEAGTSQRGPSARRLLLPALAAAAGMLLISCGRDHVSHGSAPQEAPAPAPAPGMGGTHGGAPMAMPPGAMPPGTMPGAMPGAIPGGELPPPPRPTGKGVMKWSVPKGWTETQGSGMRFATLTPPGPGKAEMSVVVLPGAAGGEVANVNRWRGQIGLPPLDEAALAEARKAVKSKAGAVAVYDFTSPGDNPNRMVTGLITTAAGSTWFFKLMGPDATVAAAKPAFLAFLATVRTPAIQ